MTASRAMVRMTYSHQRLPWLEPTMPDPVRAAFGPGARVVGLGAVSTDTSGPLSQQPELQGRDDRDDDEDEVAHRRCEAVVAEAELLVGVVRDRDRAVERAT